ncbi:FAD-binding protein [Saccharopolyspora hirsuta]|uniref:FAD-binding protein n=1 Tax=Saccharopolyspora hirsuta TaxID=1837 RepID=UPI00331E67BE
MTRGGLGINPRTLLWGPDDGTSDWVSAPELPDGGELVVDAEARRAAGKDRGSRVEALPGAVLRPAGAGDVEAVVRFAHQHGIPCAAQGNQHTVGGQALAADGIAIDMLRLNRIHSVVPPGADGSSGTIEIDAGVLLTDVAIAADKHQARVSTGYPGRTTLSAGGFAAVGGWSAIVRSGVFGAAVPRMEVVTPDGQRLLCSADENAEVYNAVLGGVGQHGIITRLWVDLVPAPSRVSTYTVPFNSAEAACNALRTLSERPEPDELHVTWKHPDVQIAWLEVDVYDPEARGIDCAQLLAGYGDGEPEVQDRSYLDFVLGLADPMYDFAEKQLGWNELPKAWADWIMTDDQVTEVLPEALPRVQPLISPTSVVLLAVKDRAAMDAAGRRNPPLPEGGGDKYWLMDCLLDFPSADEAEEAVRTLHDLHAFALDRGARIYSIGSFTDPGIHADTGLAPGTSKPKIDR